MSRRNGDRARFHKELKRKHLRRQRAQALVASLKSADAKPVAKRAASKPIAPPKPHAAKKTAAAKA